MSKVGEVADQLEECFPLELQEDWDNSGPFKIFPDDELTSSVVSLDPVVGAFRLAAELGSNLVVTHHPFTLSPLKTLNIGGARDEVLELIFSKRISLISLHTNLDWAKGGVNDEFCALIGAEPVEPIETLYIDGYKLVTFLPRDVNIEELLAVLDREALGGIIGNYRMCSFFSPGTGTFLPGEGASPRFGEKGKLNMVDEVRLEIRVSVKGLDRIFSVLKSLHPYEEPPVELFPMKIPVEGGRGRIAEFSEPVSFEELMDRLGEVVEEVKTVGGMPDKVKRFGVCLGRGISLYRKACARGIDLFITGDLTYHDRLSVLEAGVPALDVGHEAEKVGLRVLERVLKRFGEVFVYDGL